MKRTVAVLALVGAGMVGSVALAAPASAAGACVHVDITVNGESQVQDICLP